MTAMDRLNKEIHYLYHSKKNEEALPIALFFGALALIFNGVLFYEFVIWSIYFSYCQSNNKALNKDPYIIKERERLLDFKRKIERGELKFADGSK